MELFGRNLETIVETIEKNRLIEITQESIIVKE